ncbi:MAG: hypothetical protein QM706_07020 [Nitrospira sp.]
MKCTLPCWAGATLPAELMLVQLCSACAVAWPVIRRRPAAAERTRGEGRWNDGLQLRGMQWAGVSAGLHCRTTSPADRLPIGTCESLGRGEWDALGRQVLDELKTSVEHRFSLAAPLLRTSRGARARPRPKLTVSQRRAHAPMVKAHRIHGPSSATPGEAGPDVGSPASQWRPPSSSTTPHPHLSSRVNTTPWSGQRVSLGSARTLLARWRGPWLARRRSPAKPAAADPVGATRLAADGAASARPSVPSVAALWRSAAARAGYAHIDAAGRPVGQLGRRGACDPLGQSPGATTGRRFASLRLQPDGHQWVVRGGGP